MSSATLGFDSLTRFSDRGLRLHHDDVRALWIHLMSRPVSSGRTRFLQIRDEGGRRVRRSSFESFDETRTLVVTRDSLRTYGAHLRTLKGSPRFFTETRGLNTDMCALLMDWLNDLNPPLSASGKR